jgi:hypothetical protein
LLRAIEILSGSIEEDHNFTHVNEAKLYQIVISESSKAYLTREVDEDNQDGLYKGYKKLVARVADIIGEISPDYKYPNILISTVIEGAQRQRFFAQHLPGLTNVIPGEDAITQFYLDMVFHTLGLRLPK